jgi:hypothetical protein
MKDTILRLPDETFGQFMAESASADMSAEAKE